MFLYCYIMLHSYPWHITLFSNIWLPLCWKYSTHYKSLDSFKYIILIINLVVQIYTNVVDIVYNNCIIALSQSYFSLSVIYIVFSVCNWMAPSLIVLMGPKMSMFGGSLLYLLVYYIIFSVCLFEYINYIFTWNHWSSTTTICPQLINKANTGLHFFFTFGILQSQICQYILA